MARRRQRIRFEALPEDVGDRLASAEAGPELAYDAEPPRPRDPGRARRAAARLPGRRRALRPRAAVLRRDRGDPQRQGRHRPLAHPPRPGAAARGAGPPRAGPAPGRARPRSPVAVNLARPAPVRRSGRRLRRRDAARSRRTTGPRATSRMRRVRGARSTSSGPPCRRCGPRPRRAADRPARAAAGGAGRPRRSRRSRWRWPPTARPCSRPSARRPRSPARARRPRPRIRATSSTCRSRVPHVGRRTQQLALVAVAAAMMTVGVAASASADTASPGAGLAAAPAGANAGPSRPAFCRPAARSTSSSARGSRCAAPLTVSSALS